MAGRFMSAIGSAAIGLSRAQGRLGGAIARGAKKATDIGTLRRVKQKAAQTGLGKTLGRARNRGRAIDQVRQNIASGNLDQGLNNLADFAETTGRTPTMAGREITPDMMRSFGGAAQRENAGMVAEAITSQTALANPRQIDITNRMIGGVASTGGSIGLARRTGNR